jgi:hypothetical protein
LPLKEMSTRLRLCTERGCVRTGRRQRRTLRSGRPWRWTGTHDCTSGLARDDGRRGADCRVKRSGATTGRWPAGRGGDWRGWFRAFGSSLQRRRTAKAMSEIICVSASFQSNPSVQSGLPDGLTATNQPFLYVCQAISSYCWLYLICIIVICFKVFKLY